MRSSSPTGSSPSKTPFLSSASRRYVSKVYSRRPTLGSSAAKWARTSDTPETDGNSSPLTSDSEEDEQVEPVKSALSAKERAAIRRRDNILTSPKSKAVSTFPSKADTPPRNGSKPAPTSETGETVEREGVPTVKSSSRIGPLTDFSKVSPVTEARAKSSSYKRPVQRTDTVTSIASAPDASTSASLAVPHIAIQPATSSPSVLSSSQNRATPSTPPRKRPKRNPSTPTASPRDLSSLFAPVSPAKSPHQLRSLISDLGEGANGGAARRLGGGGLFKRMLDKSQSLGGLASPQRSGDEDGDYFSGAGSTASTPPKALVRTHSLPSTPSISPLKEEGSVQATSLIVPIASSSRLEPSNTALGSGANRKRTYGRSRTMLAEMTSVNDSPGSGVSSVGEREVVKESYAELRKQFEVDNSGTDQGQGNLMLDLLAVRGGQTVSDLRSKGENRRFMDELGYLVDPILDPNTSMGLKRSSIFDVLRSMQDEVWLQRAKICGQVERIWEAIYDARGEGGDELTEAMSLLYLANLVQSGSGLESILRSHGESCVATVMNTLRTKDGPLDEHCKAKVAGLVIKVRNMYLKLGLPWTASTLSTRRLASYILAEMTPPQHISTSVPLLSAGKAVSRLVKTLVLDVTELSARFDLVESGLDLVPEDRPPDVNHIAQCLTVLSRLISHEAADRQSLADMPEIVSASLVSTVVAGTAMALHNGYGNARIGSTILLESLPILAAMCTSSLRWCEAISTVDGGLTALARALLHRSAIVRPIPPSSQASVDDNPFLSPKKAQAVSPIKSDLGEEDLLCLVLAILTTAATTASAVSDGLASMNINVECLGAKACLRTCRCPNAEPFSVHLTRTYLVHSASQSPTASLIAAYLALLLGHLIGHDVACRTTVLDFLPGQDDRTKIRDLIEVLSDLGGLQNLLQTRLRQAAGVDRAESTVDSVEEPGGVVQAVVDGLQQLLDELEDWEDPLAAVGREGSRSRSS